MALSWAFCICLEAGQGGADWQFLTEVIPQRRSLRGPDGREKAAQGALKGIFAFAEAKFYLTQAYWAPIFSLPTAPKP